MKYGYSSIKKDSPQKPRPVLGDSLGFTQEDGFKVGVTSKQVHSFNMFLDNQISSAQDFRDFTQVFMMANEDDRVNIFLCTPGGDVDGTMMFLQAEQMCQAPVTYFASGTVYSAGAIILCNAQDLSLHPHTTIGLHCASFGAAGKAIDAEEYAIFSRKKLEDFLAYHCSGVLSREDLHNIFINKKELLLGAAEFMQRWMRKQDCLETMASLFKQGERDPSKLSPEDYTELMLDLVESYEEEKLEEAEAAERAKRKPAKRKAKPAVLPEQSCSGSCDCK